MCAALTENVVLIRTRSHDLKSVKKLNCWGCALKDVSIVHRMPNVEVISLSINSIDTLENFAACTMLQELYLRKNEIKDINEILHLSQLQYLKKLSLEDNPCTNAENYRLTVLKALPNLEFLDNVRVTPEEIYQAEKTGRDLVWPGSEVEMPDEEINELNEVDVEYSNEMLNHASHPSHHDSHTSLSNAASNGYPLPAQESAYCATSASEEPSTSPSCSSSYQAGSNASQPSAGSINRSSGSHLNYGTGVNAKESYSNGNCKKGTNMAKSNSLSDYNLYHNGNYRAASPPPLSANNYEPSEYSYENGHSNGQAQVYSTPTYHQNGSSRTIQSSASSQPRLLPKGGKNRNANILSAVLCLIKELDYGSLEVVDTTIHCRMEEMED